MAKIQLGVGFQSIRGKIGTGIYQVWKGIQIVRNKPAVISQPNSTDQSAAREKMAEAYDNWLGLTALQRNYWEEMATQLAGYPEPPGGIDNIVPKFGGKMSGFNAYCSLAIAAVIAGGAWPTDPPLAEQRPSAPLSVAASYASPTLTITWIDPQVCDAAARVRIWLRSRHRVYHRQMLNTTLALGIQTRDETGAKGAGGFTIPFTVPEVSGNERLSIQMDTVNPSGMRSEGSNVAAVGL
jgi:hypothetical protein